MKYSLVPYSNKNILGYLMVLLLIIASFSCKDDMMPTDDDDPMDTITPPKDTTTLGDGPIDFSKFSDTYGAIANPDFANQWMHYNVHDPSIMDARSYTMDAGDFFYCYNTDVAFGYSVRPGLQIRRSKNLVEWEFVGWVFNGVLPSAGSAYITSNGGTPNNGLWAPYAMKVGDKYRVYYSLASNVSRLSCIGLAESDSPKGPFIEKGVVVRSMSAGTHTNAIDPSVIVDKDGKYWMFYGSSWDGIYVMELDATTGLAKTPNDIGVRVAHRGFTGSTINGNIEGAEIIFNEDEDTYYLFIAYDWLETKYNVRVGRSDNATGPFLDINGQDMNQHLDDLPMILAPYKFIGHSGWQGVSHPAVFEKDGEYFIAHQGRPGENPFYMVLHVRQIHWTEDGWPMVSPERYAAEEETSIEESELAGTWEQIVFGYQVVPGFANEQITPGFQNAVTITLDEAGTIGGNANSAWTYSAPWLTFGLEGGDTYTLYVERGRDWENEVASTILYTGFNQNFTTIWGKKIE